MDLDVVSLASQPRLLFGKSVRMLFGLDDLAWQERKIETG